MTTNTTALIAREEILCTSIEKTSKFQNESYYHLNCSSNNFYSADDRRLLLSPIVHWIIGGIMLIVFVLGLCENMTVLFVYVRTPKLRTVNSVFVIGLSLSDLGQTLLNIPFVFIASFSRQWIFGNAGCMYIGCVTTWFGITQISLLCVIAIERYFIIVHKKRKFCDTITRAYCIIVLCFTYGLCFAIAPVIGWSEYKLVAGEISCSINWTDSSKSNMAYIFTLFVFVWFLPLSFVIFGYIRITMVVCADRERRRTMKLSGRTRKSSRERKVAITVLLMVGAFVISWTPYSVVALMSAFSEMSNAPASVYLVPAAFAKASIIWNPIIYISRHRTFKQACTQAFKCGYENQCVNESENKVARTCRNRRCRDLNEFDKNCLDKTTRNMPLLRQQSTFWSSDYGSYFKDSITEINYKPEIKDTAGSVLNRNKQAYMSIESTQLEITDHDAGDIVFCDPVSFRNSSASSKLTEFLDEDVYLSSVQKLSILQKRKVSIHHIDCSNTAHIENATVHSEQNYDPHFLEHIQPVQKVETIEQKQNLILGIDENEIGDKPSVCQHKKYGNSDFIRHFNSKYAYSTEIISAKRKEYSNVSSLNVDLLDDVDSSIPMKKQRKYNRNKPSIINFEEDSATFDTSKRKIQHKQIAKVLSADNDSRYKNNIYRSNARKALRQRLRYNCDKQTSEQVVINLHETLSKTTVQNIDDFLEEEKDIHGHVIRQSTV